MKIYMQEQTVNKTEGYKIGDSGVFESRFETKSEIYEYCLREYGRCIGKCYVDTSDKKAKTIGWVFLKRVKYEDCNETYLQETWISLHEKLPVTKTEYFYA